MQLCIKTKDVPFRSRNKLPRNFEFQGLGIIKGVHHLPKVVFLNMFKIHFFLLIYYSAYKKATAMIFIWGDRGYPAVRFEYKKASERYLVGEL